jgi:hypothetical protein
MRATVIAIAIAAVAASASTAAADERGDTKGTFGIGLVIGEPTGVCAKLYLKDDQAIQGAIGSAFVAGGIQAHADYVWHPWILEERDSFTLPVYLGPGLRVIDYDKGRGGNSYVALGVRVVGGIMFDFRNVPLDAFLEVAGVGEYGFSSTEGGFGLALNAGAGVRYYF